MWPLFVLVASSLAARMPQRYSQQQFVPEEFCSVDAIQVLLGRMAIKAECKPRLELFEECCKALDSCYNRQEGQTKCDDKLCECVRLATKNTDCQQDAGVFCSLVRVNGRRQYAAAALKRHRGISLRLRSDSPIPPPFLKL